MTDAFERFPGPKSMDHPSTGMGVLLEAMPLPGYLGAGPTVLEFWRLENTTRSTV